MYSPNNKQAVLLESSTGFRVFGEQGGAEGSARPIPSRLYYATFVALAPSASGKDLIVLGGATKDENGLVLGEDHVLLARKHARPMMCRVIRAAPSDSAREDVEIWTLWSDSILAQTVASVERLPEETKTTLFELNEIWGVNDMCVLNSRATIPDVTGWRKPSHVIITGGTGPSLASFALMPKGNESTGKSLLAVAAASAITSVVSSFARRWLMTDDEGDHKADENGDERDDTEIIHQSLSPRVVFEDEGREVTSIAPGVGICAAGDNLGRVILFLPSSLQILRMLKGYRSPQLCFLQFDERPNVDLLLILAPLSRGNKIELWRSDSERPFAVMDIPVASNEELRLASSSSPRRAAIIQSCSGEMLPVTLEGLNSEELDWDNVFLKMVAADDENLPKIEYLPSMLRYPERVLRRLSERKDLKGSAIIAFLKAVASAGEHASIDLRLNLINALIKFDRCITLVREASEVPEKDPLRWALELYKSDWHIAPLDERILTVGVKAESAIPLLFNYLLVGDVFLVHEIIAALKPFPRDKLRDSFVRWSLSCPVERSVAWTNTSSSNALVRMAQECEVQPEDFGKVARGRIGLARALCFSSRLKWEEVTSALDRAFHISVLVDSDELDINTVNNHERILDLASDAAVIHEMMILNPPETEKKQPWEFGGIGSLQTLLGDSALKTASARDDLRLQIAKKAIRHKKWTLARHAMREVEETKDWSSVQEECVKAIPAEPPLDPHLARLLMHVYKDIEWKRDIANALVLADELHSTSHFTSLRELIIGPVENAKSDMERAEIKSTVAFDLFRLKLASVNDGNVEDEVLRSQARAIGISEPNHVLCEWHWVWGRDERGNECFNAIASPKYRASAAQAGLRICRRRLSELLRKARKEKATQKMLAALPPKAVTWILQAGEEELQYPVLRSTQIVLLSIAGDLPNEKAGQSSTITPYDRCTQLQNVVETYLAEVD